MMKGVNSLQWSSATDHFFSFPIGLHAIMKISLPNKKGQFENCSVHT